MTTMTRRLARLFSAATLAATAACAGGLDDLDDEAAALEAAAATDAPAGLAADDEPLPLAVVERQNGNVLEIYEASPGAFYFSELGDGAPVEGRFASITDLFLAAAPTADELPAALVDAQDRADALGVVDRSVELGAVAPGLETADAERRVTDKTPRAGACSSFTCFSSSGTDQHWCKTSWSNGFYASATGINVVMHKVCSKSGTFTTKILVDSVVKVSKTVSTGQQFTIGYISHGSIFSSGDFNHYTQITSASGDTFATTGYAIDE